MPEQEDYWAYDTTGIHECSVYVKRCPRAEVKVLSVHFAGRMWTGSGEPSWDFQGLSDAAGIGASVLKALSSSTHFADAETRKRVEAEHRQILGSNEEDVVSSVWKYIIVQKRKNEIIVKQTHPARGGVVVMHHSRIEHVPPQPVAVGEAVARVALANDELLPEDVQDAESHT